MLQNITAERKVDMKKTEEKKTTAKTSAAAKKVTAAATELAAKTTTAAAKKAPAKPAKTTAKKAAPAPKKTTGKPKPVTIDTICGLLYKKIDMAKAAKIDETIAVDIEVWGFEDGSNKKMYVEVMDGKVSVMPHTYEAKSFRVSLSFANAMNFVKGKITLKELLGSKDFYAEGNIVSALKLAVIF